MLPHIRHQNLLLKWGFPIWRLLLKKTRMFVKQVQGSIISRNWLMISICREGSKCDDWQITEDSQFHAFCRLPESRPPSISCGWSRATNHGLRCPIERVSFKWCLGRCESLKVWSWYGVITDDSSVSPFAHNFWTNGPIFNSKILKLSWQGLSVNMK